MREVSHCQGALFTYIGGYHGKERSDEEHVSDIKQSDEHPLPVLQTPAFRLPPHPPDLQSLEGKTRGCNTSPRLSRQQMTICCRESQTPRKQRACSGPRTAPHSTAAQVLERADSCQQSAELQHLPQGICKSHAIEHLTYSNLARWHTPCPLEHDKLSPKSRHRCSRWNT